MIETVKKHLIEVEKFISTSKLELEKFRKKFLGKKGVINNLFLNFKQMSLDDQEKKEIGQIINLLKNKVNEKINILEKTINNDIYKANYYDLTRPGTNYLNIGSRHPISIIRDKIINIFYKIGFEVVNGPEIETDWYNFTALNFSYYHPARDMQDTFFIDQDINNMSNDRLLRTHTSSVQIRFMENNTPPIRILCPGRVFRNETISKYSNCIFHQIEGLYVDKKVSFSDLKQVLFYFTKELFGNLPIRFRPSYFPFTEPSAELDVYWKLENKIDDIVIKESNWLEIMGCGMVDPNVLENVGIDSNKYSGYAFGLGIERIVMLLYKIEDIRMLFENDVRLLEQFKTEKI